MHWGSRHRFYIKQPANLEQVPPTSSFSPGRKRKREGGEREGGRRERGREGRDRKESGGEREKWAGKGMEGRERKRRHG